jgi:hypothetical protein
VRHRVQVGWLRRSRPVEGVGQAFHRFERERATRIAFQRIAGEGEQHAVLLPHRDADAAGRIAQPGAHAAIGVGLQADVGVVEFDRADRARLAEVERRYLRQRQVSGLAR